MAQVTENSTELPDGTTFLEFCNRCCERCRVVRWLGEDNPPEGDYRGFYQEWVVGKTWSRGCPLCQQLSHLVPLNLKKASVRLHLFRLDIMTADDQSYRSDDERPFDLLYVVIEGVVKPGWSKVLTRIKFALVDMPGGQQYEVKAESIEPFVNWKVIRRWIGNCEATHGSCKRLSDGFPVPGLKIIDCETGAVETFLDNATPYVALSYVWGESQDPKEDYPQTVLDSMEAVLALGLRYLWVDRIVRRHVSLRVIMLTFQVYRPERQYSQVDADRDDGPNLPQSISYYNFLLRRCRAGITWDAQTPSRLTTFALPRRLHVETHLRACRICGPISLEY